MISGSTVVIIVGLAVCCCGQQQEELGSACIVERTRASGICKHLEECVPVINDIKRGNYFHTRCVPFAGNGTEIVCCPGEKPKIPPGKKSEKMCDEYKLAVFEEDLTPSSLGEPPTRVFTDKCAQKSAPLTPNSPANRKEYPHMALIGFDFGNGEIGWPCGATLISDEYVLGAGHCSFSKEFGDPKYVRLDEIDVSSESTLQPGDYHILTIISHPEYGRSGVYHDIALFKLNRKVELSPEKRPACLPTKEYYDNEGSKAIFTGWGQDIETGGALTRLRQMTVQVLTANECNATYASRLGPEFVKQGMIETQMCTGSKESLKDFNDSGGPLQIYHPHQYCMFIVIGTASFGKRLPFERSEIPDFHTRIFPYVEWIENVVWENVVL